MATTINKKTQEGFVAGSRKHLVKEDEVERTFLRSILSGISTFVITKVVGIKIKVLLLVFWLIS
jgi:hypothetical protein